jgi:hypothetical protein
MIGHLSRHELLAYAEGLVDNRAAFERSVAQHVHACPQCAAEIAAIRQSLEIVAALPELEPSAGAAEQILLAARQVRSAQGPAASARRGRLIVGAFKGVGYAAALIIITGAVFHAAIAEPRGTAQAASPVAAALAATPKGPESDAVQKATTQVNTLVTALTARQEAVESYPDQARLRAVLRLDADIGEAMAVLEQNPSCERAQQLVDVNRRRQAETLRRLFAERNL